MFASSAMDGFAVRAADVSVASGSSPVELKIAGRAMIGKRPEATVGGGEAVQIATGAPIPAGADAIVPVENGRRLAARLPKAEFVELPGRGHNLMLEDPETFNRLVTEFLSG